MNAIEPPVSSTSTRTKKINLTPDERKAIRSATMTKTNEAIAARKKSALDNIAASASDEF